MGTQGPVGGDSSSVVGKMPEACADEQKAVELMEELRWENSPVCPRCDSDDVYKMTKRGSDERNDRFLWRCRACSDQGNHDQYTVRTGTVMEQSKIPLKMWCYAFWRACSSKKGISAMQIKRETGLTYKSAWFLMHRIREAMRTFEVEQDENGKAKPGSSDEDDDEKRLCGTVEADETYIGGEPRYKGESKRGRGTDKTPVMVLVERNGDAVTKKPTNLTAGELQGEIDDKVDGSSTVMTDEFASYQGLDDKYDGGHHVIKHSDDVYAEGEIHVNTAESYFSLLKRGVNGTFHFVSDKHLARYCDEFSFRWNRWDLTDGERIRELVKSTEGKRLMYSFPDDEENPE